MIYDKIIIGAGLYGLYSALFCAKQKEKILVLEYDNEPFKRATYINQARVHMGYHYPRSYSTAIKSAHYFDRFNNDYSFCVHSEFEKIYATSKAFSWTNAEQFQKFCDRASIKCNRISSEIYFKKNLCDGAFITKEYTYDAQILKQYFLEELEKYSRYVTILYNVKIDEIKEDKNCFRILTNMGNYSSDFVLNATYASTNQIIKKIKTDKQYDLFKIKYELCEIILCETNKELNDVGITVMDGPFFSIMPFGKTGYHSLTSVTFTPHVTSYDSLPQFECQQSSNGFCSKYQLGNCNDCPSKPKTAWNYMSNMVKKYLRDEYKFKYIKSLFSMKPILQASEIDDSRPTVIRELSSYPKLISVLSGKINTVYDLDEVLKK